MTREHLLRAAARQFVEGDVQHWWLPHSGQGVRTRDLRRSRYGSPTPPPTMSTTTGDVAVLDEAGSLPGRPDARDAASTRASSSPIVSDETATLFEHCARGLDQSLAFGAHGLPLIGTGDWNDGMNRVGEAGQGRERLARLVPARHAHRLRSARRCARRTSARGDTGARTPPPCKPRSSARLGRRLVSARLVRRRHAARLRGERGMPDRLDRTVLGGDLRRRGPRARRPRHGGGRTRTDPSAGRTGAPVHAALRPYARSIPATSKAIRQAFGRTAANIRTPLSGR